ncbi:hypothetical protein OXIME_000293 [Oxyplasma meridianum]|uniref:Uncharacterized protein n=1 Tax=Oxyplasma meridianum TaxID=3073602 RepID=A0AAX4NG55_9ARCH
MAVHENPLGEEASPSISLIDERYPLEALKIIEDILRAFQMTLIS